MRRDIRGGFGQQSVDGARSGALARMNGGMRETCKRGILYRDQIVGPVGGRSFIVNFNPF